MGSSATRRVDVRVVATSNQDLAKAVEEKRFRQDLYFRLNVVPLVIPPLRERREDIVPLTQHFLQEQAQANGHPPLRLTPELMDFLLVHSWPGNVRELENLTARLHVVGGQEAIDVEEVRGWLRAVPQGPQPGEEAVTPLAELQKQAGRAALARFAGHRRRTAKALGISVRTLQNKIKRWLLE